MNASKQRINAKINLTLDVTGRDKQFHKLESLVAPINVYDTVTVKKRKDGGIRIKEKGIRTGLAQENNNVYKAARLFSETFSTLGADITVKKRIPIGQGLGGSSADIAGVLLGMKKVYGVDADLKPLSAKLGSDVTYQMSGGGLAVMHGKGDEFLKCEIKNLTLSVLIILNGKSVSSKDCYSKFDALNVKSKSCTKNAYRHLHANDLDNFAKKIKNDLYPAALTFAPEMETAIMALKSAGALTALMTGSGSAVYGVFRTAKERNMAYKNLKEQYGDMLLKAETL